MNRMDIKNMHSKELRTLRNMIREELDFRADVGSEIANKEVWMSSTEWGVRVQELRKEENKNENAHEYIEEVCRSYALRGRMEHMRDWDRENNK